jgi:hypothetical protein
MTSVGNVTRQVKRLREAVDSALKEYLGAESAGSPRLVQRWVSLKIEGKIWENLGKIPTSCGLSPLSLLEYLFFEGFSVFRPFTTTF